MNYLLQPIIQIEDSDGKPLVGGKVYVYDSETQNLSTIYRDFEGHYATNPVILDSLGHAKILADEEKVYTVVVKDKNDNLQFTLENVGTVGTGGGSEPVEQQKVQVTNGDGIAVNSDTLLDGTVIYRVAIGNDIKNRITKNENDIANMESSHTARLSALENTSDNHEIRITNNEINIGALQSGVSSIDSSVSSIDNRLNNVESKIPYEASSSNKLADKQYVMNVVSQMAGRYITNAQGEAFETHAKLIAGPWYNEGQTTVLAKNDYAIVNGDETHGGTVTRYMYDGTSWAYQYTINATVFTQEQLNAMNSGITSAKVDKLDGIAAGAEVNVQSNWNQTDTTKDDYIKNKPGNASTTSSGFMSAADKVKLNGIAAGAEVNIQSDWNVSDTNSKAYIVNKPTSLPASDVYQWAKATTKPSYTAAEVGTYSSNDIDTKLAKKITANTAITGATKCKITYDSNGLVTAGANLAASDIPSLAADKITSGTFADSRIASASTWNAKADNSTVVHNTGDETIAGRKTFTSSPIFNASIGNTDIQAYKPRTTTQERCSLTYTTDGKRGIWDSNIDDFALLIDSSNQVTLNGTASRLKSFTLANDNTDGQKWYKMLDIYYESSTNYADPSAYVSFTQHIAGSKEDAKAANGFIQFGARHNKNATGDAYCYVLSNKNISDVIDFRVCSTCTNNKTTISLYVTYKKRDWSRTTFSIISVDQVGGIDIPAQTKITSIPVGTRNADGVWRNCNKSPVNIYVTSGVNTNKTTDDQPTDYWYENGYLPIHPGEIFNGCIYFTAPTTAETSNSGKYVSFVGNMVDAQHNYYYNIIFPQCSVRTTYNSASGVAEWTARGCVPISFTNDSDKDLYFSCGFSGNLLKNNHVYIYISGTLTR